MKCPIDGKQMDFAFKATVLGKYDVSYYRCGTCSLIQPQEPYWLEEAYSSAIADTDVGLVLRNRLNWRRLAPLLHRIASSEARILDVGGGYGLLCRGLRDDGFDCYTTDAYCENLFAKGFEPGDGFSAEVLLAFEVMEHITNPLAFVREQLAKYGADTLVFSTLTHSSSAPPPLDWWYHVFESGQHVSLYHENSLQALAAELGLNLYSLSKDFHVLTRHRLFSLDLWYLQRRRLGLFYEAWVGFARRGRSWLERDYQAVKSKAGVRSPASLQE
ncbi:MAG: class I SAM-dependent methyltransferase [Luteolibacter sp.]